MRQSMTAVQEVLLNLTTSWLKSLEGLPKLGALPQVGLVLPEDDFMAAAKHAQGSHLQSDIFTAFPPLLHQAMEAAYARAAHIQEVCWPPLPRVRPAPGRMLSVQSDASAGRLGCG